MIWHNGLRIFPRSRTVSSCGKAVSASQALLLSSAVCRQAGFIALWVTVPRYVYVLYNKFGIGIPGDVLSPRRFRRVGVLMFSRPSDTPSQRFGKPPLSNRNYRITYSFDQHHTCMRIIRGVEQTVPAANKFRASGSAIPSQNSIPPLDP
ncbi:hypothetical protein M408DRAFT_197389 [Serendipita vermifera MAFF 305830]|uniref:Uncharacterized protein n=1 Tax=Serendipita vermifera MAFF 305830 TaxID=933852 RepID=A0A0C3B1Z9_SERVB|nr:hypothetical protein M408DRAFT_197389 [Serendipita vermifera MAFF 305830]